MWRRQWQPTPVLLPGKSHGWRRLVDYIPQGHQESDTAEPLTFHFHFTACCISDIWKTLQFWGVGWKVWVRLEFGAFLFQEPQSLQWRISLCLSGALMALELGSMLNIGLKGVTGFPGGSDGKDSACNVGDLGSILGWEDPLEKGMAAHSSILVWRIPWTEEPGRL